MADTPANPDSGAAGTEYQTVLALRRLGHEVDTVWADELPHRIRHNNLHYLAELPFAYRTRMLERMQSIAYDVVHVNQPHGYLAARALSGRNALPVFVHRSHGLEPRARAALRPWQKRYAEKRPVLRRLASGVMETLLELNNLGIARYADGHIVSASLCGNYLHRHYGVSRHSIAVIPQAPPGLFLAAPVSPIDARRLNRLLYVGQFAFFKAPMILAAACERVLVNNSKATLTWVCDKKHHEQAASLFSSFARERVSFHHWVPQNELLSLYDSHGVFLFPSFFEGFGKAFLEAMSRGLVVVASAEGGARDIIETGRNGVLVSVGDAAALAAACDEILGNPRRAMEMSSHARRVALQYTWDRVARETTEFYRRLIQRKRQA